MVVSSLGACRVAGYSFGEEGDGAIKQITDNADIDESQNDVADA
jgi:hypothetical protein